MTTDSDIIERSRADPSAFGTLFDRHAPVLHRYLARRIDPTSADDLLGETFLVAFERRGTFRAEAENALPWLYGIATNVLHRHRRDEVRAFRAYSRSIDPSYPDQTADAAQRIDDARAIERVLAALERMPRTTRDTVLLYAWAELSYEQIAEAMDVPVGTVRSRLNRARTALRGLPGTSSNPGASHTTTPTTTHPSSAPSSSSRGEHHGRDHASAPSA